MRAVSWTTCLWPGLAALWIRGRWGGLVLAIAFGWALQFAVLRTLAPAELPVVLAGANPMVAWVCVLSLWIAGAWFGWRELVPGHTPANPQLDQWFRDAQTEYLQGHWIEAETLLSRLLARRQDDVEGRLLLAGVQRRTGRLAEARRTLDELSELEAAARWTWEIRTEVQRIAEIEHEGTKNESAEGGTEMARAA